MNYQKKLTYTIFRLLNKQTIIFCTNLLKKLRFKMIISLPLENWVDVLAFLPRLLVANSVPLIGDREFARIAHFCLHEFGLIRLGDLRIVPPEYEDGSPLMQQWHHPDWAPGWPIDELVEDGTMENLPMPENIKTFEALRLRYFDFSVFGLLQKFQHNSLLQNVQLSLQYNSTASSMNRILSAMALFLPLVDTIESIRFPDPHLLGRIYGNGGNGDHSELAMALLAPARILQIGLIGRIPLSQTEIAAAPELIAWFCQWLYNPREDGEPRVLLLSFFGHIYGKLLIGRIKKDFMEANEAVGLFIRFRVCFPQTSVEQVTMENTRTNERLTIRDADSGEGVLISRFSMDTNRAWIKRKRQEVLEWNHLNQRRRIEFDLN